MSIDTCSKCGALVDTDEDTEFYGEDGEGFGYYPSLCENCREGLGYMEIYGDEQTMGASDD